MGNINSISQARKLVREAQSKANEARVERERQNIDDAAAFLVEQGRVAAVDEWARNRINEVHAEAERRHHEHRLAGAAAVSRMQERGETLARIAELAGVKVAEVRSVLKAAGARPATRPDGLGAEDAVNGAAGAGASSSGVASQALGGDVGEQRAAPNGLDAPGQRSVAVHQAQGVGEGI